MHMAVALRSVIKHFTGEINPKALPEGVIFLVFDCCKDLGKTLMLKPFMDPITKKTLEYVPKTIKLIMTEESIEARKEVVRSSMASVDQEEVVMVVTKDALDLPKVQNENFPGSSNGKIIPNVNVPSWDADFVWKTRKAEKKLLFGCNGAMVPVGGPAEEKIVTKADDVVPMNCHTRDPLVADEYLKRFKPKAVINLTETDHTVAESSLLNGVSHLGFCHTEEMCVAARSRLNQRLLVNRTTEGHDFYSQTGWARATGGDVGSR